MQTQTAPLLAGSLTPVQTDAATLNHDRSAIALALTAHLSKLNQLSDHAQSLNGTHMAAHLPDFLRACEKSRLTLGGRMPPHRQQIFDKLARLQQNMELSRLSHMAAAKDLEHWDRSNEQLLSSQITCVRRWPLDDAAFQRCAQDGLSAIADHDRLMGKNSRHSQNRQADFLSRLTEARLEALIWTNIAVALKVFDQFKDWLRPTSLNAIEQQMEAGERLAKTKILADAIIRNFDTSLWLEKSVHAAHCEYPGDDDFAAMLQDRMIEEHDLRRQHQSDHDRQTRNRLLLAALGMDGDFPTRLETLLSQKPELAALWHQTDDSTRTALRSILRANRNRLWPQANRQSQRLFDLAVGLWDLWPRHFLNLHFGHPAFDAMPVYQRRHLIQLQDHYHHPDFIQFRSQFGGHVRTRLRAYAPLFRRRNLTTFF